MSGHREAPGESIGNQLVINGESMIISGNVDPAAEVDR